MEEDYKDKYKSLKRMFKALEQENSKVLVQLEKATTAIKALQTQKGALSEKLIAALKKNKRNELTKSNKEDEPKDE
ncbi:hypothetical protein SteCoe_22535 [Stentor coeruleus]|uniref:INO80 complex subunit F domain-containing protein n=1 Tax=Stentor coeruleus TaxID=5963 RepID=A0A1R2BMK0_9CILI|nr:hypothetical protein SteCoe_22535 [Stentor coeruleus]